MFDKAPNFENPLLDALSALPGAGLKYIGGMTEKLDNGEIERDGMELAAQIPEIIAKLTAGLPVEMVKDLVPGFGEVGNLAGNVSGIHDAPSMG